ncbi:MAG: hypothetical protein QM680_01365 [Luteolibacter sp.]
MPIIDNKPITLTGRANRWSLKLGQFAFFNGMVMANGFAIASVALLCFKIGKIETTSDRMSIGGLFLLLSSLSFFLGWVANIRCNQSDEKKDR